MTKELTLVEENTENTKSAIEIVSENYAELSKYVTRTRVYASAVDGMKAVHRRLVYASRAYNKLTKSVALVGDTSKLHVHGTGPIYDSLITMACEFNKFPIYNKKGNFGGLGHPAAAERYTEAYLSDLGRLLYLELIDYADMIDGDAGYPEPKYLPALIPYGLLIGSTGIPVGMPVPKIPPLDAMELIDFYIAKLNKVPDSELIYPRIDEGGCILDIEYEDLKDLLKSGMGKVYYKGIINRETNERFVINSNLPTVDVWKLYRKLESYINDEVIDFTDETSELGERYVFTLNDFRKLSPEEFLKIAEKVFKCSVSYKFIVENESKAVYCGLDYIVDKSLSYLRKCSVRKWVDTKSKIDYKILVLRAIQDLKSSPSFSNISTMTYEDLIELIKSLGYETDIAKSVLDKPTRYLTKSYDFEIEELVKESEQCKVYIDNPEEYLLPLYYELREMVLPFYNSRAHSIYEKDIVLMKSNKVSLSDDRTQLVISDKGEFDWNKAILAVSSDGYIESYFANKLQTSVELSEDHNVMSISSDQGKYLIVVIDGHGVYAQEVSVVVGSSGYKFKMDDWNPEKIETYLTDNDKVVLSDGNNKEEYVVADLIKSRYSKPKWVNLEIKEVI